MRITIFLLFMYSTAIFGQSKSIKHFRSDFEENSNVFIYSSTIKMLNPDNNAEFADILSEIEEIRILNYEKSKQSFNRDNITKLKNDIQEEGYATLLMISEEGNHIELFGREKRGETIGMTALVENEEALVIIDLVGNIDISKFLELKQRLDTF